MKKLKVAFCLRDMQLGGVESVLVRTLTELRKNKNIDLSVITYVNIKTEIYKRFFENNPDIKLYALYPCSWLGTKLPHFFLTRILVHIMRDIYRWGRRTFGAFAKFQDIDVFIDYHDFGFLPELKRVKRQKIAWFHSSINVFVERKFVNNLRYYDDFVALTDACANEIKVLYPQWKNKILRIYNPIDVDSIRSLANKEIDVRGKYFCCVARLSGDKDIITLLDGFNLFWLNNARPKVSLVIVGDGDRAEYFKQYANGLRCANNVVFVGAQANPYPYMKKAIANILSSKGEGLPTVLVEAAAIGTLNIASDCKYGPKEILLDGKGGLLFEPGNAAQLAECMARACNPDVISMVKKSDKALYRFDAKTITKQIISLIS